LPDKFNAVKQVLNPIGQLIIATFGLSDPPKCSGLKVVRYSPECFQKEFDEDFGLLRFWLLLITMWFFYIMHWFI